MCKVILYWLTCSHHIKIRRSHCNGTYTRQGQGNPLACSSVPYLEVCLPVQCGPCLQIDWERDWNKKIERANKFLAELKEGQIYMSKATGKIGNPAAGEIKNKHRTHAEEIMVVGGYVQDEAIRAINHKIQNMMAKYDSAYWANRQRFPPQKKEFEHKHPRANSTKVTAQSQYERLPGCRGRHKLTPFTPSNLAIEVNPEDIVLAEDDSSTAFIGTDEKPEEFLDPWDNSYTTYDNPIYAIDGDWVDGFLAQPVGEEGEGSEEYEAEENEYLSPDMDPIHVEAEESSTDVSVAENIFDPDSSWGVASWMSSETCVLDDFTGSGEDDEETCNTDPDLRYLYHQQLDWRSSEDMNDMDDLEKVQRPPNRNKRVAVDETEKDGEIGTPVLSLDDITREFWLAVDSPKTATKPATTKEIFTCTPTSPNATDEGPEAQITPQSTSLLTIDSKPRTSRFNHSACTKGYEAFPIAVHTSEFDFMRHSIERLRFSEPDKYYRSVLEIARREIRAVENAWSGSPRVVPSP